MRADEFVTKLKGVKPKGRGKWMACCPAHDDSDPSLAISEARNGNVLLKCFSGCSALDITNALGLRLEDLFADAYEEPPMAFAQREMAAKKQLEENNRAIQEKHEQDRQQVIEQQTEMIGKLDSIVSMSGVN